MGTKMAFKEIYKVNDLIKYLDSYSRLNNGRNVYHYTTISSAVSIIDSMCWHLGAPDGMNDKLEYERGDKTRWNNIFFSSFMCEEKESIGMWSMYSQPWKDGVKISIPIKSLKKWIKEVKEITIIKSDDKKQEGSVIKIDKRKPKLWLSAVAYHSALMKKDSLKWSTTRNDKFSNILQYSELTGYIKDEAWSYEKEMRIKCEIGNVDGDIKKISIPIPEYILNDMVVTAGPLFKGDLQEKLKEEISRTIDCKTSKFYEKLNIDSRCSRCLYPNKSNNDFCCCK